MMRSVFLPWKGIMEGATSCSRHLKGTLEDTSSWKHPTTHLVLMTGTSGHLREHSIVFYLPWRHPRKHFYGIYSSGGHFKTKVPLNETLSLEPGVTVGWHEWRDKGELLNFLWRLVGWAVSHSYETGPLDTVLLDGLEN